MRPQPLPPPTVCRGLRALAWLGLLAAGPALAQTKSTTVVEPGAVGGLSYALGGALIVAPTYAGSSSQELKPRPLWALRYGRFRLSGPRSSGLLAPKGDTGSGASADWVDEPHWRLGTSLRIDSGRSAGDDPVLAGLPDIRRTLRGRVYAAFDLEGRWSASVGYGSDLLGRGGGATVDLGVGYGLTVVPGVEASLDAGLSWGDRTYMATHYGITPEAAAAAGRQPYDARAGLMALHAGIGARTQLGGRWTLFGGVGVNRLQGDAAASPLTRQRSGLTASLALAWRSQ